MNVLVVHDEAGQPVDHAIQQLLVAIVRGEEEEALREHRRDRTLAQRLDHAALEQGVHVLVPHHVARAAHGGGGMPGE